MPGTFSPVLRIHDILGWIRIRILGSMPLTSGFGSGSWIRDPTIFVIDLQDVSNKLIFEHKFFCFLLFEATFTSFFKDKKSKRVTNIRNQGFSYYFCMMIEGSGSGSRAGSGSGYIPLTSGSGSGRPKNMWIRIRIRNTEFLAIFPSIVLSIKLFFLAALRLHNTAFQVQHIPCPTRNRTTRIGGQ